MSRSPILVPLLVVTVALGPAAGAEPIDPRLAGGPGAGDGSLSEAPSGPGANWIDHFDLYATGSQMHGQGGWRGWDNLPAAGALTSSAQARTLPNSVEIVGASDLIYEFSGINTDVWTMTAWQYIPSGFSGLTYFLLLNSYVDGGPYNWSTVVAMDSITGLVAVDFGPCIGPTLPIQLDQWVEIRVVIDFVANSQDFYYGGSQLFTCSWTEGASGSGALNLAVIDLFANTASSVFYDDVSLSNLPFLDGFEGADTSEWHFTVP